MKKRTGLLIVMLFGMFFCGCKKEDVDVQTKTPPTTGGQVVAGKIGGAACSLKGLEFIKGKAFDIEPGKAYIVEFWATWCGPCLTSIPHLTEVAHKYKDKNVVVVGVSKEDADVVKPFVEKQGAKMDYNVAIDPTRNVSDGYMKAFNCNGIPHAFIVDAKGKIAWHGHPMADMEQALDGVLAGTFDAAAYGKKKAEEEAKYKANRETYQDYFGKIRSGGTMEEARAIIENWTEDASGMMLNSLAWAILTEVEVGKRDLKLALEAAARATELTEGKNGAVLDTYALALFENGQVEGAIDMQAKAVDAAKGNERMEADMQKRLDKYRSAK